MEILTVPFDIVMLLVIGDFKFVCSDDDGDGALLSKRKSGTARPSQKLTWHIEGAIT
jgi:hypothetical protein